jgi:hypothetical protein
MPKAKCYENYPFWMVLVTAIFSLLIYFLGVYIIYQIGLIWLILYFLFILVLEIKLLKNCTNCYYYGKCCASGRGKISKLFFKKGDSKNFGKRQITWKDMIPDFLVSIIPLIAGIILLIMKFNWLLLAAVLLLFLLSFSGTALIRGTLACKYCKQREIGCPAENLFSKKKNRN